MQPAPARTVAFPGPGRPSRAFATRAGAALALASLFALAAGAHAESRLTLQLQDAQTGSSTAARIAMAGPQGWLFDEPDPQRWTHLSPTLGPYIHVADSLVIDLPEGSYTVWAVRGVTGVPAQQTFPLLTDQTVVVNLGQWIDPAAQGWYGGDPHVHLSHPAGADYPTPSLEIAGIAARGEGLDLMFLLGADPAHPGGAVTPAQPATTLVWGEEYRNSFWGHVVLLGLNELVTWQGSAGCCGTGRPAWPTLRWTLEHEPVGLALLAHPFTTEDAAFQSFGWPGSGHGREQAALALTDLLDGYAVGGSTNGPSPWVTGNYLDALHVGARWSAVGESDSPLDRHMVTPPGQARTYAYVGEGWQAGDPALADAWVQAVAAGRCFASTGPIVRHFAIEGAGMGDEAVLGSPGPVTVALGVSSYSSLERVTLHGATGVHWQHEFTSSTTQWDTTLTIDVAHDDFFVLDVEADAAGWPLLELQPRAITTPIWIDAGEPWPLSAAVCRAKKQDLELFWEQAKLARGLGSPADSALIWQHIMGSAQQYEALVDDPPADFAVLAPPPLEGFSTPPVTLRWSRSFSYDAEPLTYRLQIARDAGFLDLVLDETVTDTVRVVTDTVEAPGTYHWKVEALEPLDPPVLAGGSPRAFVVTAEPVAAPPAPWAQRPVALDALAVSADGARFSLSLQWPMPVRLRWFDVRGREMGRRDLGELAAGSHRIDLSALDQRGQRLARGVYWLMADSGPHQDVLRWIWLP